MSPKQEYRKQTIAHVKDGAGNWVIHDLYDHLNDVAALAEEFASGFGTPDWAKLAGLWHDLGKYSKEFQAYIKKVSGYDAENAHLEDGIGRVDHSTAGAIHAVNRMGKAGRILAYLIAGHHAGLADWGSDTATRKLSERVLKKELLDKALAEHPPEDILNAPLPTHNPPQGTSTTLWIRMLFSCLVDADFLDTERFMDAEKYEARGNYPGLLHIKQAFDAYMQALQQDKQETEINKARATILQQCRENAALPPGHFSLTVPTGGGKTLASLAFALEHALKYNKKRIIYVIPYTSIIEQTAEVFRKVCAAFPEAVIEHHSTFDEGKHKTEEQSRHRLAAENWDAPIIVTTTVQFFESLFAVRTSRVRKLHNICNSVVILDEAQLLTPEFLTPICDVMNQLKEAYGVSFVISTATQPVLENLAIPNRPFQGLKGIREIITNPDHFYDVLQRINITLPQDETPCTWPELAKELQHYNQVLCVVSRRGDCRELYAEMPKGTVHLSALMCPAHRTDIIGRIKKALQEEQSVRVISTQLVECGVDFDFPVVYRAMAGLDSIAQAAGRCNREGKLGRGGGKVVVFHAPKAPPSGNLRKAADAAEAVIRNHSGDILGREAFTQFFTRFYSAVSLDKENIRQQLENNDDLAFPFRSVAEKFRLIDDVYLPVVVRYGEGGDYIDRLVNKLNNGLKPGRELYRSLQRYVVTIPRKDHEALVKAKEIKEIDGAPGLYVQVRKELYDDVLGFCVERMKDYAPEALMVG